MVVSDDRWRNCSIKATTLLPNVLARHAARKRGFDDALFVSASGEVRECTSANVFMVKGAALHFPPRTESVLHGITQNFLFECAREVDVAVDEKPISLDTLKAADEVFLSSTTHEVLGITQIDEFAVADRQVGPVTKRLYEAFVRRARG